MVNFLQYPTLQTMKEGIKERFYIYPKLLILKAGTCRAREGNIVLVGRSILRFQDLLDGIIREYLSYFNTAVITCRDIDKEFRTFSYVHTFV